MLLSIVSGTVFFCLNKFYLFFILKMRPGIQYSDLGFDGTSPAVIHKVSVEVDGQNYLGSGRSKKIARKLAAKSACTTLWNVVFIEQPEDS